jgi:hypothetical protein
VAACKSVSIREIGGPRGSILGEETTTPIPPIEQGANILSGALWEQQVLSRGLASGWSFREIAKCLEWAVSTVSREVARHGGRSAYPVRQTAKPGGRPCGPSAACFPST